MASNEFQKAVKMAKNIRQVRSKWQTSLPLPTQLSINWSVRVTYSTYLFNTGKQFLCGGFVRCLATIEKQTNKTANNASV